MLYLLWGLINIGLFLFFIILCFQATKLVRERVGMFAAFVFVIGLLSFVGHSEKDDNNEKRTSDNRKWKFVSEDSVEASISRPLSIDLEDNLVSTKNLSVSYGKSKSQQRNTPIDAYSSTEGFVSGTKWKPVLISVTPTADNTRFQYVVVGVVEWKLLALTIYSQSKTYEGTFVIEKASKL
jgi:hypothetical protein